MSSSTFDVKDFRRALSQFPTGVTVITTLDLQGQPVGVTASSFNSVSIDPPLILWSIDKNAHSLEAFNNAKHFVVNVLGRDQVSTSNNFARRGSDKFADIDYHNGIGGCPVLQEYAAQFECKTWNIYEGGDHLIIVGEVIEYRYQDSIEPLVFARGSYAISAQHPETIQTSPVPEGKDGFVDDYLLYLLRVAYQEFSNQLYPTFKQQCNISPEEWRILARMVNEPSIQVNKLAEMVMQPEIALRQTAEWMSDKGYLNFSNENTLTITPEGSAIANQLCAIALEQEASLLKLLPEEQSKALKQNLKQLANKT